MGKPIRHWRIPYDEFIVIRRELGEVNHLSNRRKRKRNYSLSSGERKGISLNLDRRERSPNLRCRGGVRSVPYGNGYNQGVVGLNILVPYDQGAVYKKLC
jgi:hypothetical protein